MWPLESTPCTKLLTAEISPKQDFLHLSVFANNFHYTKSPFVIFLSRRGFVGLEKIFNFFIRFLGKKRQLLPYSFIFRTNRLPVHSSIFIFSISIGEPIRYKKQLHFIICTIKSVFRSFEIVLLLLLMYFPDFLLHFFQMVVLSIKTH